jgi:hypothetical protein
VVVAPEARAQVALFPQEEMVALERAATSREAQFFMPEAAAALFTVQPLVQDLVVRAAVAMVALTQPGLVVLQTLAAAVVVVEATPVKHL